MTAVLEHALSYARAGLPVFPCRPGAKAPGCLHGFKDATTDPATINRWWAANPSANIATATGAPGPDVLDVDVRDDGDGYAALDQIRRAGLLAGAFAVVQTPSGGLHLYFSGTEQRSSSLPRHHLDLKAAGGYVLVPPSMVSCRQYAWVWGRDKKAPLDWTRVIELLVPSPAPRPTTPSTLSPRSGGGIGHLARWLTREQQGNRNRALYWAAMRAIEDGFAPALDRLVQVAVRTGLLETEAHRTVESAQRAAARAGTR